MYKRFGARWSKHADFLLIDIFALEFACVISSLLRYGKLDVFSSSVYKEFAFLLLIMNCCISFFDECYRGILQRGYLKEFKNCSKHVLLVIGSVLLSFFLIKQEMHVSRLFTLYLTVIGVVFCYVLRLIEKRNICQIEEAEDKQEVQADPEDDASESGKTYDLIMASSSIGYIHGNENGAYFLWSIGEGHQVLYVNYSTKDLTAWTNQLNPTQDETNPGMIMDAFGGTKPYVTEDNVYVMKFGKLPLPSVGFPGSPCKLSKLSLDAAGRRTITLPSNQIILQNSGVAAEEDKLYLLVGTYDETGELESCDICCTDFSKEKLVPIATLEGPGRYYLVGVYDQGFLLQRTIADYFMDWVRFLVVFRVFRL